MSELFSTLNDRKGEVLTTILEHIQISFIALLIAILIAVPLGIALTKTKRLSEVVMNIAAILQTIPSLALLGLMIPIFGIGRVPHYCISCVCIVANFEIHIRALKKLIRLLLKLQKVLA